MKTKLSLSIIGFYNLIVGTAMLFFAEAIGNQIVNSENVEAIKMGEMFHYGLAPAILTIAFVLLLARNCSIDTAKNMLIGYIVGTLVLMYVFFGVLANEALINFSIESAAPDIVFLAFAVFAYLKAKE